MNAKKFQAKTGKDGRYRPPVECFPVKAKKYYGVEFSLNGGSTVYRIEIFKNSTVCYRDGKQCTNREAIRMYITRLLDSGDYKYSWATPVEPTPRSRSAVSAILHQKLRGATERWYINELKMGLELLKRLR